MAGTGKKPPDRPRGKVYKRYCEVKFDSDICVICEDVYHLNDFTRRNSGIVISETLAVCKKHTEVDITSINSEPVLQNYFKNIVTQVKFAANCELIQGGHNFERKRKNCKKIIQELLMSQKNQEKLILEQQDQISVMLQQKTKQVIFDTIMELDQTVYDETVFEKAGIESTKIEIDLLRTLTEDLQDKNNLLKDILKKRLLTALVQCFLKEN